VPLITQVTGLVGQLGQLGAAIPLVAVLHRSGWTVAFVGLAALGVLAALLTVIVVRDTPPWVTVHRAQGGALAQVRAVTRVPGTWLGFWSHTLSAFTVNVFLLLWGFPFLTVAQGLAPGAASGLLTVTVVSAMVMGPVLGTLTARHPLRRSWLVLGLAVLNAASWVVVLLQPGPSPRWLLVVLVVVVGTGGPASVIGFDFARTSNEAARIGTATGLVNVGGFAAAVVTVLAVGVVLDLRAPVDGALSLAAFRAAFAVMAVPWAVAVVGVLVSRRRARAVLAAEGTVVPSIREVLARRRASRP